MKAVRLGVVGLGLIWVRTHREKLATLRDVFEPVAFCDVSEARRAEAALAYPGAPIFSDYRELLALDEVEAVLVLTPIALNAPVALAALRAGKDVIMEKPIARSVAEGQELIDVARQTGRRLLVAEQLAYRSVDKQLAELIAAGEIGQLVYWNRIQHVDADPAQGDLRFDTTPWRKLPDYPLGALFDGGIHLIASLGRAFGAPSSVYASGRQLRPEYGEYDHVTVMFHYANGAVGILSHSTCLPPMHNYFHVHGAEGVIVVERDRLVVEKVNQPDRIINLPEEDVRANLWQALATAVRERGEPYYTAEMALQDVSILEGVDHSIKSGQRLEIG
jgi:predicted dehydrogenase